jgi:hypothetical protein
MGNNKCKPDEKRVPKFKVGDLVQSKAQPDRYGTVKHCTATMLHIALEGPFRATGSGVPDGNGGHCWTAKPDMWQPMKEKPQSRAAYARSVAPDQPAPSKPQSYADIYADPIKAIQQQPAEPPKYNPEWSYGVAERLHDAMVNAVEEYNTYIAGKPPTFYIPVDTKFSRAD